MTLDLDLAAGETLMLLGPNGSGKTTFLLHVCGLLRGSGELTVCGVQVDEDGLKAARSSIGLLFQDPTINCSCRRCSTNVAFAPLNYGHSTTEAVRIARQRLERVGAGQLESRSRST